MTGNFDINKELLDAMRIIARQEIEKCNRDITKTARVINVNNDKTVKIEMDGKQYDNIPNYNGTTLTTNDIVKVTYPQGQTSNMYISGRGLKQVGGGSIGVIGEIISYMGTSTPVNFLTCDGTVYNIKDYTDLSTHIKNHFGTTNFFGGDGSTTFAVPDLRGEFLRGYGNKGNESGVSGPIGKHQDATKIPKFWSFGNGGNMNTLTLETSVQGVSNMVENPDIGYITPNRVYTDMYNAVWNLTSGVATSYAYSARPTNVAVLYCIRYQ